MTSQAKMAAQAKLLLAGLTIALLSVVGAETARAQAGKTRPRAKTAARNPAPGRAVLDGTPEAEKPERPRGGTDLQVEQLPPELENVLKLWEERSSKIEKLQGEFYKISYNGVFLTEKHSVGKFYYESPDKGFYNVEGKKTGLKGQEGWKAEPGPDERWLCDGKIIYAIKDSDKSYEKHEIPPQQRGKNIMDGPLPFLFGMKAEEAKKRYTLRLVKQEKGTIWIEAIPRRPQDAANWKKATVIIDAKTFLPKAVRLEEPGEKASTVHNFGNLTQPGKGGILRSLFPHDPLKLDIPKNYRLVISNQSAEAESAGIAQIGPEPPTAPRKVSVQAPIQQAAAVRGVNFGTLKKELQNARTKGDLQQARVHITSVVAADAKVKTAGDRILSQDDLDELTALYKKRFAELSK
jgi:TIGR03009 family protein